MRKLLSGLLFATLALVVVGGGAGAQTYEPGSATVSNSNPEPGETFTVSGSGCVPGETVNVSVDGQSTTTTADANGDWSATLAAPSEPGDYTVTATCGARVLNSQITVGAGGTGATAAPLPRTGSSGTNELSRIGVALGAAGGVLVLLARRRRTASTPA